MQAEIELGCKITELEEIVAGLRLEREKLYAAECANHKGLRLVCDPEADGPVPEMFTQNERSKK